MNEENTAVTPQPSLFVGHGAPDLVLSDIPARNFLQSLGSSLPVPRGIVVISAHWSTSSLQITKPAKLETIHDFSMWQASLYDIEYGAYGADWLNERVTDVLENAGQPVRIGSRPGLDHGAWAPLLLMYPDADIPVVQLSLQDKASPEQHFETGQALESLRQEGILILGSGGLVHNLRALKPEGSPTDAWALEFDQWLFDMLDSRDSRSLFNYLQKAKHATMAHPSNEHLMPLFLSMGAGWSESRVKRIHQSFSYGNISMSAYAFADPEI